MSHAPQVTLRELPSLYLQMQDRKNGYRRIGKASHLVMELIYLLLQKYSLGTNYLPCAVLDVGTMNKANMSVALLELVF